LGDALAGAMPARAAAAATATPASRVRADQYGDMTATLHELTREQIATEATNRQKTGEPQPGEHRAETT
jgi:hypothetical protein